MKKVYDAVCTIGKYTNNKGEEKNRYITVGAVLEGDNGGLSLKLDAVPTNFNGYINFYVPKEEMKEKPAKETAKSNSFDDDIPF